MQDRLDGGDEGSCAVLGLSGVAADLEGTEGQGGNGGELRGGGEAMDTAMVTIER